MLPSSEVLSRLVGSLYDAASDPSLWSPFLGQLAADGRATSAVLVMHDFDHASCTVANSWELNPELTQLYEQHYHALDVWRQRGLDKPSGQVYDSQSICPLQELRTKEIYNDLYVQSGIEHAAFGVMENSKSSLAAVSLYRDRSRSEFAPKDLHILQFLVPHIQRAFKLHLQFSELKARSKGFETALDMVATPVILFRHGGKIVAMNRSASALMEERDGLVATRDGLRAERQAESALLARAIRLAGSPPNGNGGAGETVYVSRRARSPLQVLVSPVRSSGVNSLGGTITAIAFVNDPSRRQRPAQDILRTLFGLTPAECRVALLLGDGRAPKEIAAMIGVSVETVRSQMKSIFSKAGVKRQSELVRLLLSHSG